MDRPATILKAPAEFKLLFDSRVTDLTANLVSLGVADLILSLDFTPIKGFSVSIHSLEADLAAGFWLLTELFLFFSIILITVDLFRANFGTIGLF